MLNELMDNRVFNSTWKRRAASKVQTKSPGEDARKQHSAFGPSDDLAERTNSSWLYSEPLRPSFVAYIAKRPGMSGDLGLFRVLSSQVEDASKSEKRLEQPHELSQQTRTWLREYIEQTISGMERHFRAVHEARASRYSEERKWSKNEVHRLAYKTQLALDKIPSSSSGEISASRIVNIFWRGPSPPRPPSCCRQIRGRVWV